MGDEVANTNTDTGSKTTTTQTGGKAPDQGGQETELWGGKYKTREQFEDAHTNLNEQYGRQGKELGDLRGQNTLLTTQLNELQKRVEDFEAAAKKDETPATDFDALKQDIQEKVKSGDMTPDEGIAAVADLTVQLAAEREELLTRSLTGTFEERMQKSIAEALEQRDSDAMASQWEKDNPEFGELMASGEIDKALKENPFLGDPVTAYYALKADSSFEAGKAQAIKEVKGSEPASRVLADPSVTLTEIEEKGKQGPLTQTDVYRSMMASVDQHRKEAGG